ncbi:stress response NST1-like protein [Wolffia australiana]
MASGICKLVRIGARQPWRSNSLCAFRSATTDAASSLNRVGSSSFECPHDYAKKSEFLGSWKTPPPSSDPAVAQRKLALLRREYKKQVKEVRRQYAYEMEMQRLEKLRKDEARRENVRVAKAEREAAKAVAAKAAAAERKVVEEEFRQTLLRERMEKLESQRAKKKLQEKKKDERGELLRRQSSMWIDESELDKRITEALVDTTQL